MIGTAVAIKPCASDWFGAISSVTRCCRARKRWRRKLANDTHGKIAFPRVSQFLSSNKPEKWEGANMPKDCPRCLLINPETAVRCDCGFEFVRAAERALSGSSLERTVRWRGLLLLVSGLLGLASLLFGSIVLWHAVLGMPLYPAAGCGAGAGCGLAIRKGLKLLTWVSVQKLD